MNPEEEDIHLKQIRTFQGDVAEALQKQKDSLVSIQRAEQIKRGPVSSDSQNNSKRRLELFYLILGSLVLFILGGVGAWYGYTEYIRKSATPIAEAPANRFISSDDEVNLNLTNASRETLIRVISDAISNVPEGKLRHINSTLTTSEFLTALESKAPGNLVRAFDPLFMFGAYSQSTFIIIKLSSFENAYDGMLTWEPNLSRDIGPLFATAMLLRSAPPEASFGDLIDQNKDIRVLTLGGQPVLLYTFLDNNILIITDNLETLRTLLDRLTREKLSR